MSDLEGLLARLVPALGPITEAPRPLEGGITNRNFLVAFAGRRCVVRLPGKDTALLGISREAERLANARAAELAVAPPVVFADRECLITGFVSGRPCGPAIGPGRTRAVAALLRRFHDCGLRLPASFWVPDLLDAYAAVVHDRGGRLPDWYGSVQALAGRIAECLPLSHPVPCHNDLLPANLLELPDGGLRIVDWEYAGMGHRLFDLGNFAVNCELDPDGERELLRAYFGRPPDECRRAALRLMRLMSDAREAAWGVVQSVVSELHFDFNGYTERHHQRLRGAAADLDADLAVVAQDTAPAKPSGSWRA